MTFTPTNFDDEEEDYNFFEEFNNAKDEDEKKLMKILQNLIDEMNDTKELQQSLHRDRQRDKFVELTPETQIFADIRYLATYSN